MFAGIESIDAGGQGTYFLAYIRRIKVSQVGGISAYLIEEMPHLTQGKQLHSWGMEVTYIKSRHRIQAVFRPNATSGIEEAVQLEALTAPESAVTA